MLAQRRKVSRRKLRGLGRDDHLTTVRGGHDARGFVHIDADVLGRRGDGFAGVDAHPYPDSAGVRPLCPC